jgi:NAD(P)-dependent dehydrogenase (short-subunit alcohol dehydrogenase family)
MRLPDRVVVITGAAGGIGSAMARRFAREKVGALVLADIDGDAVHALAGELTGTEVMAATVDVTVEPQVAELVAEVLRAYTRIDLFCANAGVTSGAGLEATDEQWSRTWSINVMSHIYAARAVLPSMLERGDGYLLQTCSAAGLLTAVGDAPYAVTKHAAVAFAEYLAITYGGQGIKVSALCPQGVDTPMLRDGLAQHHLGALVTAASGAVLPPESVADAVVEGLDQERMFILPHPEVATYYQRRATAPDRWIAGVRDLAAGLNTAE